jgi:hypothetical protein
MSMSRTFRAAGATRAKLDRDNVSTPQRVLDPLFSILAMALMFSFFAYHQMADTGFFTREFGPFAMVCFYGPIILSPAASIIRAVSGHRNTGRPLEVLVNLFLASAALWLLVEFPFDFSHFADALPAAIRFVFAWVNNDIGKIVLILQIIIGSMVAFATAISFLVMLLRTNALPDDEWSHRQ